MARLDALVIGRQHAFMGVALAPLARFQQRLAFGLRIAEVGQQAVGVCILEIVA